MTGTGQGGNLSGCNLNLVDAVGLVHAATTKLNHQLLFEHVLVNDFTWTIRGLHPGTTTWQLGAHCDILFVFIGETAEQTPTDPTNFRGIEGEILILGHLDTHTCVVRQKRGAAEDASTGTNPAKEFGLIAWADLTELNTTPEGTR